MRAFATLLRRDLAILLPGGSRGSAFLPLIFFLLVGRYLDQRMRERTDFEPIELEPPESAFPEKLVVFLDSA